MMRADIVMPPRRKRWLWIGTMCGIVLMSVLWFTRETDPVAYHLRHYRSARSLSQARHSPMRVLSYEYLLWTLKARPSIDALDTLKNELESALVRLGYFQRREFQFDPQRFDASEQARLRQMIRDAAFTNSFRTVRIHSQEAVVRVTACPGDMRVMEDIIRAMETR